MDPDPVAPPPSASLSSPLIKDGRHSMGARAEELNESQGELLASLRGLNQASQSWRSKLETQLKTSMDEFSELKKELHTEIDQLRELFKELKTTLQDQQSDVATCLGNLADPSQHSEKSEKEQAGNCEQKSESSSPATTLTETGTGT